MALSVPKSTSVASTDQMNCERSTISKLAPFGLQAKEWMPLPPAEPRKSHKKKCWS